MISLFTGGARKKKMKVLLTGDSHTGALTQGVKLSAAAAAGTPPDIDITVHCLGTTTAYLEPFYRHAGDHLEITSKECNEFIATLPVRPDIATYDAYGFTGAFHIHRVVFDPFFTDNPPSTISGGPTSASRAMIRRLIFGQKDHYLAMLVDLKRLGVNIFVIETPLLFRHHAKLVGKPVRTPCHLTDLVHETIRGFLAEHGIPLLPLPPECHDAERFMLPEYRHLNPRDQHHANAQWGELMIRKVREFCPTLPRPA